MPDKEYKEMMERLSLGVFTRGFKLFFGAAFVYKEELEKIRTVREFRDFCIKQGFMSKKRAEQSFEPKDIYAHEIEDRVIGVLDEALKVVLSNLKAKNLVTDNEELNFNEEEDCEEADKILKENGVKGGLRAALRKELKKQHPENFDLKPTNAIIFIIASILTGIVLLPIMLLMACAVSRDVRESSVAEKLDEWRLNLCGSEEKKDLNQVSS